MAIGGRCKSKTPRSCPAPSRRLSQRITMLIAFSAFASKLPGAGTTRRRVMLFKLCNGPREIAMAPTKRQLGFTILEVVMAITLMSGVLLILFTGLRLSMNALRRGNENLDAIEYRLGEADAVQSQVSAAIPASLSQTQDRKMVDTICFRGDSRQVRFLSRDSWAGDRAQGLWMANYRIVQGEDGKQQLEIAEAGILDSDQILNVLLEDDFAPDRSQRVGETADRIEFLY